MISSYKLPLTFDPAPLQKDLAGVSPADWQAHFNTSYFQGEWSGVALRSSGGAANQIYPDPHASGAVIDTEILARCPNLQSVLSAFACPISSARLLKLSAGASIREHRDYNLSFADNELRLHVPIFSNPEVLFYLDAERVVMKEGECWYLDFTLPHWVKNNSTADRVHLVIDCQVNDWLRELFAGAADVPEVSNTDSVPGEFERFRQFVLSEPLVQTRLRQTNDTRSFVRLATRLAYERGFRFNHQDVEDALQFARKTWLQRWIV